MFKRTKGYVLLTMLVLTGLAGRRHSDILSAQERHYVVSELKNSGTALLFCVSGLPKKLLSDKVSASNTSVHERLCQLLFIQKNIWDSIKAALKQQPSDIHSPLSDSALLQLITNKTLPQPGYKLPATYPNAVAIKMVEQINTELIRYARTSTQNVRRHLVHTPIGMMDSYQAMLLVSAYTWQCARNLKEMAGR